MSIYQQDLRRRINTYDLIIRQTKAQIQETIIELENETNVFDKIRLMRRLRTLRITKNITERDLKDVLREIH